MIFSSARHPTHISNVLVLDQHLLSELAACWPTISTAAVLAIKSNQCYCLAFLPWESGCHLWNNPPTVTTTITTWLAAKGRVPSSVWRWTHNAFALPLAQLPKWEMFYLCKKEVGVHFLKWPFACFSQIFWKIIHFPLRVPANSQHISWGGLKYIWLQSWRTEYYVPTCLHLPSDQIKDEQMPSRSQSGWKEIWLTYEFQRSNDECSS